MVTHRVRRQRVVSSFKEITSDELCPDASTATRKYVQNPTMDNGTDLSDIDYSGKARKH